MKFIYKLLYAILLLNLPCFLQARQQDDGSVLARMFLQVCNHYQHFPLQLRINIKSSANYLSSPADTMHSFIEMDVNGNNSYINTGSVEQIINDSLMIVVNKASKVIVVYPANDETKKRMSQYLKGASVTDSSIKKLTDYYTLSQSAGGIITIKSYKVLGTLSLPYSESTVKYNTRDTVLKEFIQTIRKPVPIDSVTYARLDTGSNWNGKLFSSGNEQWYLIKEQITDYMYEQITHENIQPPVEIKDRLLKDSKGNFYPAKGFQGYKIFNNL